MDRDVLILNKIAALPAHQDTNVELAAASRSIDLLGRRCNLVVCLPGPMQPERPEGAGVFDWQGLTHC